MRIDEVEKLLQSGQYKKITSASPEKFEETPKSAKLNNYIGAAYNEEGLVEEAERYFRQATRLDGETPEFHHNLGMILQKQGKLDEAKRSYSRAVELDAKLSASYNQLGGIFFAQEKYDEALKAFFSAIRADHLFDSAYLNMGNVFYKKGDMKSAARWYEKAVKLNPENVQALQNLTTTLFNDGRTQKAIEVLRWVNSSNPDDVEALLLFAKLLRDVREIDEAFETAKRVVDLDPNNQEAFVVLGRCLEQRGDWNSAVECYISALQISEDSIGALRGLANAPRSLITSDIGAKLLSTSRQSSKSKDSTDIIAAQFFRANCADKAGNYLEAWELYKSANAARYNSLGKDEFSEKDFFSLRDIERQRVIERDSIRFLEDDSVNKFIYIFGPSRSGKTTVEHALCSNSAIIRGYESSAISQALRAAYKNANRPVDPRLHRLPLDLRENFLSLYLEEIDVLRDNNLYYTSTFPHTISSSTEIAEMIPNCSFVFVKRAPEEVAVQMFRKNYKTGNFYSYDLELAYAQAVWYNEMIDLCADCLREKSVVVNFEDFATDPNLQTKMIYEELQISVPEPPVLDFEMGENDAKVYVPLFEMEMKKHSKQSVLA